MKIIAAIESPEVDRADEIHFYEMTTRSLEIGNPAALERSREC
jgi:hypothetical protein